MLFFVLSLGGMVLALPPQVEEKGMSGQVPLPHPKHFDELNMTLTAVVIKIDALRLRSIPQRPG